MIFFVKFGNNGMGGSFPIQIPNVHFLLGSVSLWSSAQSPRRSLKLRSTIITKRVMVVFRVSGSSCVQPDPDNEDRLQKRQAKDHLQAKRPAPQKQQAPSSECKPPSCSSSSGDPLTSEGSDGKQSLTSSKVHATSASPSLAESNITGSILSPPSVKHLDHISKGIKTAFGVLEGWKLFQKLHAPPPEGVLLVGLGAGNWVFLSVKATKFFAKGLKVSQNVLTSGPFSQLISKWHPGGAIIEKAGQKDLASLAKAFNTFYAAIKVVQFTKGLGCQPQEVKVPDGISIWKGYKFFKSLLSVLDAVVAKNGWAFTYVGNGFLAVKKTIGGIGVVVKAALLSKELCMVVLKGLAISGGTLASALRADHEMLMNRCHHNKPQRCLCMALTNESNFHDLLLVTPPHGSESLSSLIFLFQSFTEDLESLCVKFCEEDELPMLFCLAIPLPSSEICVHMSISSYTIP